MKDNLHHGALFAKTDVGVTLSVKLDHFCAVPGCYNEFYVKKQRMYCPLSLSDSLAVSGCLLFC